MDWVVIVRGVHVATGFAGLALGTGAALWPRGRVHRWVGRAYAGVMLASAGLSVRLAWRAEKWALLALGALTFVAGGWRALRLARRGGPTARRWLTRHVRLMGVSLIAAWTAFLVTNPVLGPGLFWVHALVPTAVGTPIIERAVRRVLKPGGPRGGAPAVVRPAGLTVTRRRARRRP